MGLMDKILTEPAWLVAWVMTMMVLNTAAVFFLSRTEARWILGAWIGNVIFMSALFEMVGYVRLLGRDTWNKLPESVRKRFGHRLRPGESKVYAGHTIKTERNRFGGLLTQLLRLAGAPLPLERANDGQAAIVSVTERQDGQGQFWSRQYNRKTGFPQVIQSAKSFTGPTGLEEMINRVVGMTLWLIVEEDALLFVCDRYFLKCGKYRVFLPRWLTGGLTVGHHDHGDQSFDFTLDLHHPLFGQFLHQRIRFYDMERTP